ncbi:uncharacterized protein LOC129258256 [Lytechinus pictus]|uniref:uncharacterized protein LOC129258256 n=1 Tax=Lytechinus pictus TaxID=7653 RepID=UPI00240D4CDF|nr:uncharacterized protein LOC129258256 [Lytechinus pictus]
MSVLFSKALPETTQVLEASGERLEVEIDNPADLASIKWKHCTADDEGEYGDEVDIKFDGVRVSQEDSPEAGTYAIVFQELVMADDGKYICIATDKKGGETRVEGDVVIEPLPETARNLIKKKEHKA